MKKFGNSGTAIDSDDVRSDLDRDAEPVPAVVDVTPTEVAVPAPQPSALLGGPPPADDVVEIPRHIREEAERYAQTLQAISEFKVDLARPRRWWQFWR